MQGHIQLGAPGALRPYLLVDPKQYQAMIANPMAARVSSGGKYGEIDAWSFFVQEDWQMGVGQTDPEAGGSLFAELDSRVPRQLLLPPASNFVPFDAGTTTRGYAGHLPQYGATFATMQIGAGQTYTKIAVRTRSPQAAKAASAYWSGMAVWGTVTANGGTNGQAQIYTNSGGLPGTSSNTLLPFTDEFDQPPQWILCNRGDTSRSLDTDYWASVGNQNGVVFTLWGSTTAGSSTGMEVAVYNGTNWSTLTGFYPFHLQFWWTQDPFYETVYPSAFVRGDSSRLYYLSTGPRVAAAADQPAVQVYELSTTAYTWTRRDAENGALSTKHVALFDGVIYFAIDGKLATFTVGGTTVTTTATDAHGFETWNGYLWRWFNNQVYYTTDGATWTGPIDVGPPDYAVRSMGGLEQEVYAATDEGLYVIAAGDVALGIMRWGSVSSDNGADMANHGGALYIAVGGRVLRFTSDGTTQDVFTSRDDDLPASRLGKVEALIGMNTHLVALVAPALDVSMNTAKTLWAYNGQGWHHLGAMPVPLIFSYSARPLRHSSNGLFYDYGGTKAIWAAPSSEQAYWFKVSDYALNPYNDPASRYMPTGWLETARFYGGQVELVKDWESVRVWGDFPTGSSVQVYWKDEGSTAWELLGTADADGEELRWSNYATRPAGRWVKLGLRLQSAGNTTTPKATAVGLKFLPMVTDRERWQLTILVSDNQEGLDGTINPYTADQQLAHLQAMIARVPPLILEDIEGTQYEVKVVSNSRGVIQYEVLHGGELRIQYAYALTLEQVTDGTYTG